MLFLFSLYGLSVLGCGTVIYTAPVLLCNFHIGGRQSHFFFFMFFSAVLYYNFFFFANLLQKLVVKQP